MRKVHMIGIAGVGMSATALLLKEAGWEVSGSDDPGVYGPPVGVLERALIGFSRGYKAENIPADVDCFVIGRNAKLDPKDNAEVAAAVASGKKTYSFPEIIGELTMIRSNVVVAGSYAKSTTTSLIAHILRHSGVNAGYFIGAEPVLSHWLPGPAQNGSGPLFVLEGDEYPSGHGDSRAKFLHLHPRDVVITSLVHDHVNVYPTVEEYEQPFKELLKLVPDEGLVVVCADEPGAHALVKASKKRHVGYGLFNGHYQARDVVYGAATTFVLYDHAKPLGELETSLLGAHNVENITAAAAYLLERELVTFEQLQAAVKDFKGVRRRLDNVAPGSTVPVFEGFGSSYEKARAAIDAMRLHFRDKPLIIVFEPHTFGWRNSANLHWYDGVFEGATKVYIAPPEKQGAKTHDQLKHETILARVGVRALPYRKPEDVVSALAGNEVVLILTSGDLHGTLESLAKSIGEKFA